MNSTTGLKERAVWQVAAGPADRSYADQFLNHGVALIGPGDPGAWSSERSDDEFGANSSVRRFAEELRIGDALLLRKGVSTVYAVGLVASDYRYLDQFDDVNGWDLQHGRRVRWQWLPEPHDFERRIFRGRLSCVRLSEVVGYTRRFLQSPPTDWQTRSLPALPPKEPLLETPPSELQDLVAQVQDLAALYWDADAFGNRPMEDELIAHYVVPCLRALGWPPERIAVQWRNTDVCVFAELPRRPENCQFVIEAKRLGAGLEGALGQARGYVSELGVSCDVVVTDGIRYRMYEAARDFTPVAYANLARLKRSSLDLFDRMRRA